MSAQPAQDEIGARRRRRRWIAIAVVLGSLVLVRAALPMAAKRAAGWAAMTYLGLEVGIRDVDLGLLAGRVAFDGLSLTPPHAASTDGSPTVAPAALLTWERVVVNLAWRDLLRGRLRLNEVSIRAPSLRIARQADGSLDPLAGAAPTENPPEDDGEDAESGFFLGIDRFVMQAARLRIVEAADESELLALELDDVEFEDFLLEGDDFAVGGIDLRGPRLRVVREFVLRPTGSAVQVAPPVAAATDEAIDGDAHEVPPETIPPETVPSEAVPPEANRPESRPLISEIAIEGAEFSLLAGDRTVQLVASLNAKRIARDAKTTFPLQIVMEADGGKLELTGEMAFAPFVFAGDLRWNNLPIPLLAVSLNPDLAEWVRACRAGGEVSVDIDLGGSAVREPSIRIAGNADVSGLDLLDPRDGALSLAWKNAKTQIEDLTIPIGEDNTAPLRIVLANVEIDEPNVTYTHPSDAIARLLRGPEQEIDADGEADAPPESSPGAAHPPEIRLSRVEVRNGSVQFTDENVTPKYEVSAREFSADLRGVSLGGPVVIDSVDAAFRSRGNTHVRATGRLGAGSGEFDLDLDRVALPPLNGYAADAGIEVVQGALSSESKVHRDAGGWTFDNDLTLHDLKLDPQGSAGFGETIGMPTDVMLALLRGPSGNISLPVQFSIGRSEAGSGVSSSIASALRQALVGAASIPLKSVGSLLRLGGRGMRIEAIPAEPGFPTLSPGAETRIAGLVDLLDEHPKLGIVLVGSIGDEDEDGMAMRILAERLEADGGLPETVESEAGIFARRRVSRAIRARARGEVSPLEEGDDELLAEYVEATEVPAGRLRELAQQRAQQVLEYLVTKEGVAPEQIRISEDMGDDDPGVEIEFFRVE